VAAPSLMDIISVFAISVADNRNVVGPKPQAAAGLAEHFRTDVRRQVTGLQLESRHMQWRAIRAHKV
jgi:hypothetical protein